MRADQKNTGRHRDRDRKKPNRRLPGLRFRGHELTCANGQCDTKRSAHCREHQTFRQHMADQVRCAGAQRLANLYLLSALDHAR